MNTQEFFSELYKGVPSEKVTYCYTLPGRKCKPFAVGEMEQLAHRAMELSATENVYFGLHTMDHAPRPGGRASAEEITGVAFLHGEYDVWGQGHQETRLPETQEEVLNFLHALEQPPSIIVSSGNGVHTYWLLEDYVAVTDDNRDNIGRIMRGHEKYTHRLAAEHGWRFDTVSDLARILRVPGTLNHKSSPPGRVEVIEANLRRYPLAVFEQYAADSETFESSQIPFEPDPDRIGPAERIISRCPFMQHCQEDAGNRMRETMNVKDAQIRLEQLKNGKIPPRETPALANPMYAKAYDGFLKYGSACDTLREGSDGAGGFLVPDEFEARIVTALKERNVLRQLVTVRTTRHPLKLTKAVGEGHAVWVPEEGIIPEQSSSFEQLQLGAYKLATMVRVTDARRADFDDYNAEKLSSRMQKAVVNLAKNLAFSSDPAFAGDWIYARVPAADTVVQDSAARCLSMPSLKIVKTGAGETFARQTVQANKTGKYTFSAYIKTEGLTGGGAFLRVKSGSTIVTSAVVQGSTDSASCGPAAEGWERVYVSVDSSAGDITLELVCGASGGTAHFACPQLEEGEIANRANLLTNGDFARTVINTENTSADRLFPADWIPATGISTDTSNCVLIENHNMPTFLSGNALQMVSFPASANVGFNQEVPVSGAKGDVFVIGGWVSSHSVSSGSDQSAPCIAYRFTNGSTDGAWQYANFNREWVGWQFGAWAIAAPTAYTKVTFSVNYARNAQTAMFSNMFLYREQFGQSFDYDSNKNLISVENLAGQKSEMKYDSYDNLTSYVQPGAPTTEKYTLTYGSTAADQKKHLVQSSSTPEGVDQQFQYDAYGNLTQSKTVDGTNAVIGTKTEYALNSNYPSKTYDARGNAVTRSINGSDYTLTSVTDPAGQAVTYAYDAAKRVTGVQTQADGRIYRNSYKYEKDRIETVAHNTTGDACDVVYRFNYDGLGRKTSVQVGNATSQTKTLSTNKYSEDRSGLLTEVEYGNSTEAKPQKVKYFYDDFDRLTGVAYDSEETPRYTYAYDASGEVAKVTDKHLSRTIETERDLAFRPRQSTLKDAGGNTLYRTTLYYDGRNRLEKFAERAGSADYVTAYSLQLRRLQLEGQTDQL